MSLSLELRRLRDAIALLLAGLSPRSRLVVPSVPDHRYQMVLSRYLFACRFAEGRSVLDLGCGAGFGSDVLRQAGATRYLGVEEFQRPVAHARRRYGSDAVTYRVAPLTAPGGDLGLHGLVLAFDVLSRYHDTEEVLRRYAGTVADGGTLVAGVPLVGSKEDIERALAAGARTVLYPWYWAAFFREHFEEVRFFRHCGPPALLDWDEPSPSPFSATDFRFEEEETPEGLRQRAGLSAFLVGSRPRR